MAQNIDHICWSKQEKVADTRKEMQPRKCTKRIGGKMTWGEREKKKKIDIREGERGKREEDKEREKEREGEREKEKM